MVNSKKPDWILTNKSWIFSGIGVLLLSAVASFFFSNRTSDDAPSGEGMIQQGSHNVQAGSDINISNTFLSNTDGILEITRVRSSNPSELDLLLRNLGDTSIVISNIKITIMKIHPYALKPVLNPSAKYSIPINGLKVGDSRTLSISYSIEARKSDRLIIDLATTNIYQLTITLDYNKDEKITFETING